MLKVGLTAGTFDIVHAGHILMFKECKKVCDYLIVALQVDPSIDRKEKSKPVEALWERYVKIDSIGIIDEIIPYTTEAELYELTLALSPDVRILGSDHEGKPFTGDDIDMEVYFNKRNHNLSSTSLKERIYESRLGK